jgi:FHA domain
MSAEQVTQHEEVDLEATAELPLHEVTAYAATVSGDDLYAVTDVYPADVAGSKVGEFEATLRDIEGRLQRKNEQVARLTRELGTTQQQLTVVAAELAQLQQKASQNEAQLRAQLQRAELQLSDVQGQKGVQLRTLRNLEADLAEMRRRSERQREALSSHQGYQNLSQALLAAQDVQGQAVRTTQQAVPDRPAETGNLHIFEEDIQASARLYEVTHDSIASPPVHIEERRKSKHAMVRRAGASAITYSVGRRATIGRTPENDIQIDVASVSRNHAVMLCDDGQCYVEDLNSTNGVKVNGRRIDRQLLHDGDVVTIGTTDFTYQFRA